MHLVHVLVVGNLSIVRFRAVDFDNAVGNGIHKLLVVRGEQHTSAIVAQPVVERGDRFQIQVVGRFVENEEIAPF